VFRWWLSLVVIVSACGVAGLAVWHREIAGIFVAKPYRSVSELMPWIGLGYGIRVAAYVFERVCYAYGRTRRVLAIQILTAVATVVATPIGVLGWGLRGAAMAGPVYYSVELAVAVFFARRTRRQAIRAQVTNSGHSETSAADSSSLS